MVWIPGDAPKLDPIDWNRKFRDELRGELDEETARQTLGKFFMHNIGIAVYNLTGFILEPYQRIVIKGWMKKNFTLCVAGRSFSKCIDENALILTKDAGYKAIKEISVGEYIWADKGYQIVEARTDNPIEDGFKLKTKYGYECTGKLGHKVLRLNPKTLTLDWVNIQDIKQEDSIPIRYGVSSLCDVDLVKPFVSTYIKKANQERDINLIHEEPLYHLLGVLLGDGCTRTQGSAILIANKDKEIIESIKVAINRYMPKSAITIQSNKSNASSYRFYSMGFRRFVENLGFNNELAHKKVFPRKLLGLNKRYLAAFIRGLYDTDGYTRTVINDKTKVCYLGLTSSSYDIIKTVQSVLLGFGIVSSINHVHKAGPQSFPNGKIYETRDAWTLMVTNTEGLRLFRDNIGFSIARKQKNIDDYLAVAGPCQYHFNLVPVGSYLKEKYGSAPFRKLGIRLHSSISTFRLREIADYKFIDEDDRQKIKAIVNGGYYFSSIDSITPVTTKTIDIQVANESCYWSDGFINHNSFLFAHFCYLYCLFNPDHHVLMTSATFRSSRRVLENIDAWSRRKRKGGFPGGELLRETFAKDMTKKQDMYKIEFKNGSTITAVPLGDPDNLRGFRCNVLGIDEGLLIPKTTIELVLKPFLAGGADITRKQRIRSKEDRLIAAGRQVERRKFKSTSKMIILSSASYRWEELYETYKQYFKIITHSDAEIKGDETEDGVSSYLIQQLSYKVAREDLMDPAIVKEIKEKLIPESVIKREYEAQFIDESGGYFSAKEMGRCTVPAGVLPCTEIVGEKGAEYVLGIDPSMGSSPADDHFAMCVLKIIKRPKDGRTIGLVVHQYGCAGPELKHHIAYLHYLLTRFNIVYIVCDTTQGTNSDFINICNESEYFKQRKMELNPIQAEFTNESFDEIIKQVQKSYNPDSATRRIVQKQYFSSPIIRAGNEYLRACFDQQLVWFASHAGSIPNMIQTMCEQDVGGIHRTHPEYTDQEGDGNMFEFSNYQGVMIEQVKKECALIEVTPSPLGNLTFDLPHNMTRNRKNEQRNRKDNYSALWLAVWGLKILLASRDLPVMEDDGLFVPRLV